MTDCLLSAAGRLFISDALHDFTRFCDLSLRFGLPQEFIDIYNDDATVYIPGSFFVIKIDEFLRFRHGNTLQSSEYQAMLHQFGRIHRRCAVARKTAQFAGKA